MRIVLVDPSRAVQRAMARLIEQGGHCVRVFADGLEALDWLTQEPDIRALITSTQPFGISGIDLCKAAHRLSRSRALHVILMSSTDDYHLAVAALDNGADDFIPKPPNPDELRARLRLADRVTAMKQQLIEYATTDFLTGLLNRRAFLNRAFELCQEAQSGRPLSAIMCDVDHFKRINDTYGHESGDSVLAAIGCQAARVGNLVGRLGGEEFCILVSGRMVDGIACAEELREAIRRLSFQENGSTFGITCSFGVAEWEKGDTLDQMLRRADIALYEAKSSGRDRVIAADPSLCSRIRGRCHDVISAAGNGG